MYACLQNGCTANKYSGGWFSYIHYCVGHSPIDRVQFALDTDNRQITFLAFPKFNRRCRLLCFVLANLYGMYMNGLINILGKYTINTLIIYVLFVLQYSVLYKKSSKKAKKKKDKLSDDEEEEDKKLEDCDKEKKSSESETDEKVPESETFEHDNTLLDTESGHLENPK